MNPHPTAMTATTANAAPAPAGPAGSQPRRHWLRGAGALALAPLLTACGFQLRGSAELPFPTLYINAPRNNQLANELRRNVRAGTSTTVTDDPKAAAAIFDLTNEFRAKDILSLNSAGRVREYALRYTVAFRIHDGRGKDLIPSTTITLKREISFNESAILANESEETLMYRDMQSDLVQQILRRMAAVRGA